MRYAIVIGPSWRRVKREWLREGLNTVFVGVRVDAEEAYVLCDASHARPRVPLSVLRQLEKTFQRVDADAWTMNDVFVAQCLCIATALHLAHRGVAMLDY